MDGPTGSLLMRVASDAPDGILLTWLPGCYQPIGWRDAEELYHQIGDAIWDDQGGDAA